MARPRKPEELKVVQGTFRPDRANPERPALPKLEELPEAPEWLGVNGIVAYYEYGPMLIAYGVLNIGDILPFQQMCALHDQLIASYSAGRMPSAGCLSQFRQLCVEFGMTPASRSKVRANVPEKPANKFTANRRAA
jgi:phage terminase small subunit